MNTMTARALTVGLLIALWAWLADVARLHLALWAGVVALGCFYAAGGGGAPLPKTVGAAVGGGVWVRSEEDTAAPQSPCYFACRLLLVTKKRWPHVHPCIRSRIEQPN